MCIYTITYYINVHDIYIIYINTHARLNVDPKLFIHKAACVCK